MNYLILGGGPAGLSAATALRHIDQKCRVRILTREKRYPYARIALPYLVANAVEEELLFLPVPPEVEVVLGEEAAEIDSGKREVHAASGKIYPYDKLLIATGACPLKPKIPGVQLPFVRTIREFPDAQAIRKSLEVRKTGRAVVAGAGPVGLELGDALGKLGYKITLVISSDRVFSTMLDAPASAFLEKRLAEKGVEVRTKDEVVEILTSGEVILRSGERRLCDLVIFGKGVAPDTGFLTGSGVQVVQGIPVDTHLRTNVPGIYAAGDVAETRDILYEDWRVNALWPEALQQGRTAAFNMASRPLEYEGSFPRNALRVFNTTIQVAGMSKAEDREVSRDAGPDFHRKIVLENGVLKGFIFLGDTRNIGLYCDLLRRKTPVSSFAGSLLRGSLSYAKVMREWKIEYNR
jgi:NAD(P)H-nitrite reductase large subunit